MAGGPAAGPAPARLCPLLPRGLREAPGTGHRHRAVSWDRLGGWGTRGLNNWSLEQPISNMFYTLQSGPVDNWDFSRHLYFFFYFYLFLAALVYFVAACGLSQVAASRGYSLIWRTGFSLQWLLLLRSTGSREHGLQELWHTDLVAWRHVRSSRPGIKPVSPALTGGFLTTGPPGKSKTSYKHYTEWSPETCLKTNIF